MGTSVGRRFVESEVDNYELPESFVEKIRNELRVYPDFQDRLDCWRGVKIDTAD